MLSRARSLLACMGCARLSPRDAFESGKSLVAFDGATLLLLELRRRGPEGGRRETVQREEDRVPKEGSAGTTRQEIEAPGGSV